MTINVLLWILTLNFLVTILENTLHWKQHTDIQIIKLNTACYTIRTLKCMVPHYLLFLFLISTLLCPMALNSGATPIYPSIIRLQTKKIKNYWIC
jgi:hypothetical protein